VDPDFAAELQSAEASWRRVSALAITHGLPLPAMTGSLGYFDTYRR
jgi:6-phosphogluconate dehydrogenase